MDDRALRRRAGMMAASRFLFAAVLLLAPLPYGANRPLPWSLLALALALAALLRAGAGVSGERQPRPPAVVGLGFACLAAVAGWAALQGMRDLLPAGWAHPLWGEVGAWGLPVQPAVALAPERALDNVMRFLAYLAAGWLAFLFAREERGARWLLHLLLLVFALQAAYGLLRLFAGLEVLPGVAGGPGAGGNLSGSFVNRNHAATFLGMGFLAALALLMERVGPGLRERRRTALQQLLDGLFGRQWYVPTALILIGTAVLLTASRGGFASLLVASVFLLFTTYLTTRPAPLPAAVVGALLLATGWTLLTLGGEPVLERLLATEEIDTGRLQIYALALEMIRDRPWLGQGYGGFEPIFMLYRDPRFGLIFDRAHNTYLEHAVELGLPATILLYGGMALLLGYLVAGVFRRRRNRIFPLFAAASTVLVGLHALVDFSVQIPAVAVAYAAIMGLGLAQATPRRGRRPAAEVARPPAGGRGSEAARRIEA